MSGEPPIFKVKAIEEFFHKVEKLPDILPKPHYDPPMTYFNNSKSYAAFVPYDLFYNFNEYYDEKSSRDDRKRIGPIMENIYKEEENKFVPVTSQLWYGRPLLFEKAIDNSNRFPKASATKDFYRRQGINISAELEQKPEQ